MASPACHKPPALHGIPRSGQRPQHFPAIFPVAPPAPPQPEPLPSSKLLHSFLIFPHPAASVEGPFFRSVFSDAGYDTACSPPSPGGDAAAENSAIPSSSSSSDFCMSSSSENEEDDTGSSSASLQSVFESEHPQQGGPLDCLSSLCAALPIKRGLSRYFSGKSQSFSSLACVSSVEDLAKPSNGYVKRRRTARPDADSLLKRHSYPPRCPTARTGISKRPPTRNRHKSFRSIPCADGASVEGITKCFSVPEF